MKILENLEIFDSDFYQFFNHLTKTAKNKVIILSRFQKKPLKSSGQAKLNRLSGFD